MRVDKYLSIVGLIRRTEVKKEGVVIKVNNEIVKPSKDVKIGDVVEFQSPLVSFKVEVLKLPEKKSIPASRRNEYFKMIYRERKKKKITSEFIKWLLED